MGIFYGCYIIVRHLWVVIMASLLLVGRCQVFSVLRATLYALMCCLVTSQHITFNIVNNCSDQSIWPALTGNTALIGSPNPLTSSSPLFPKQSIQTFPIPLPWSGRIWARQFCASDGTNCLIGDCSESTCWGHSSQNTSLFEITASDLQVVYDVSLGTIRQHVDVSGS